MSFRGRGGGGGSQRGGGSFGGGGFSGGGGSFGSGGAAGFSGSSSGRSSGKGSSRGKGGSKGYQGNDWGGGRSSAKGGGKGGSKGAPANLPTKQATLEGHTDTVTCLVVAEARKQFFSGSTDGSVKVWSWENGFQYAPVYPHPATTSAAPAEAPCTPAHARTNGNSWPGVSIPSLPTALSSASSRLMRGFSPEPRQ